MQWVKRENNEFHVTLLKKSLGIDELFAKIILNRGVSIEKAKLLVNDYNEAITNPYKLNNMTEAVELIRSHMLDEESKIYLFNDYDCDGLTSGYVMQKSLEKASLCDISAYYPERSEGYGLNMEWCKNLIEKRKGFERTLVVTTDNGITQVEEVAFLKANNIDVIVTDHHEPKDTVPDCIIINPHNDEGSELRYLAGCGVAFKVAQAVLDSFNIYDMEEFTPYVAVGTLADMMPMSEENIAFIKYGLNIINSDDCPLALAEFKRFLGKKSLTAKEIAWDLAPRINSCGRLNEIELAKRYFLSEDAEETTELFAEIERVNNKRKSYSDKAKKLIAKLELDKSEDLITVLELEDYPPGVVGIVAGEIQKITGGIAVAVTEVGGILKGSARGVPYLNLQDLFRIETEKDNLLNYGGHAAAAGVAIAKEKLDEFRKSINEEAKKLLAHIDLSEYEATDDTLYIDEELTLSDLSEETFNIINTLPYDRERFTEPVFALSYLTVAKKKTSKNNPSNICFTVRDGNRMMDIWAWGFAEKYKELGEPKEIHIAGALERNFMNPKSFTVRVEDIQAA